MALGVVLLVLPLALAAKSPWPNGPGGDEPTERTPSGFRWNVQLGSQTLDVEAPVAVVESIVKLPIVLSNRGGPDALQVDVCESWDCLMPQRVSVPADGSIEVDAVFVGRAPRLKIGVGTSTRECCDRTLTPGRAVAFAGPAWRSFAFPSAQGVETSSGTVFAVDVGTIFLGRPDLLDGFGAAVLDDGFARVGLKDPLQRFMARGGVLSMLETDARALGLVDVGAVVETLTPVQDTAWNRTAYLETEIVMRLEDRMVRLPIAADRVVRVGGGSLILRAAGRGEGEQLGQIVVAAPHFGGGPVQLDPRQLSIVNVASAGLSPERHGAEGFAVVVVAFLGIGLALWRGLKRGPVVAAGGAVVVGVVGALVLVVMRLVLTGDSEVKLQQFGPGQDGRRVTAALGRSPGSFGVVNLSGAPGRFASLPSTATVVGDHSWSARLRKEDGQIKAQLSSSSGLVGLWFGTDDTPGGLRLISGPGAHGTGAPYGAVGRYENTLPWKLDYVLLSTGGHYERELRVMKDVAAGATFDAADAVDVSRFGSAIEERFARDVFNGCNRCAVGITTIDGVLTAIEASR
ncbi:MAG: hypothetical protein Q8O67_00365 [Deltaproteobacteria bacterium]|nr:hypothetical protein [Deltaproteobacteria bacterium]